MSLGYQYTFHPSGPIAAALADPISISIGPVIESYSLDLMITRAETIIGPVVEEYTIVALNVANLVARTLGPVVELYTLLEPVGDYEQFRTLGPVIELYTIAGFNVRQKPPVIRTAVRYPVVFIHNPEWPYQQWAVLTTASDIDRSFVGMQAQQTGRTTGQAQLTVAVSDPQISRDILRHGALLVIESPNMPTWAGPILTIEEQDRSGSISLSALSLESILDGRVTPQGEEYKESIGESAVFRSLIDRANARNQTGILVPVSLPQGRPVSQLQVGGQSVMEALNELTTRSGSEWWLDIRRTPRHLEATVRLGYREGIDLSGSLHLYQGVHFTGSYKSDLSQVKQSVVAFGDFGREMPDRNAVAHTLGGAPGIDFGAAAIEHGSERMSRALSGSLPPGLRTEKIIAEVMTDNTAELALTAARAHERPLGAGEMFNDAINSLVDWNKLRPGNYYTRHGMHQGQPQIRVVRIMALQPDEAAGVAQVVLEALV